MKSRDRLENQLLLVSLWKIFFEVVKTSSDIPDKSSKIMKVRIDTRWHPENVCVWKIVLFLRDMRKQRAIAYPLMVFFLFPLASCILNPPTPEATPTATLEPSLMDRSLLTGEPCPAPCWYGLEPGKTTKEEALERVKTLSFIDPTHISETDYQYSWGEPQETDPSMLVSLPCRQPQGNTCAKLEFVDHVLKVIYPIPNYPLSFGDVVAHLGPPDYFRLSPVYPDRPKQCEAVLIWKERRIWVSYFSDPNDKREDQVRCSDQQDVSGIRSGFPVEQIIYGLPEAAVFVRVPLPDLDHPWTGFSEP